MFSNKKVTEFFIFVSIAETFFLNCCAGKNLFKLSPFFNAASKCPATKSFAFGIFFNTWLNALKIIFVSDEAKGGTEELEKDIETIDGVNSVEVIDVRRALG